MSDDAFHFGYRVTVQRTAEGVVRIERQVNPHPDPHFAPVGGRFEVEYVTLAEAKARGFDFTGPWTPPRLPEPARSLGCFDPGESFGEALVVESVDRERGIVTLRSGK